MKTKNLMKKILSVSLLAVFMFTMNLGMLDDFGVQEAKGDTPTYSIKVKNTPSDSGVSINENEYTAYRLFDVTSFNTDQGKESYVYKVNEKFAEYTYHIPAGMGAGSFSEDTDITGENLLKYVQACTEEADKVKLDTFANKVLNDVVTIKGLPKFGPVSASEEQAVIDVKNAGYYLVAGTAKPTDGAQPAVVASCALTTAAKTATITPKVDATTLTKTITKVSNAAYGAGSKDITPTNTKGTTAQIGDTIEFTLTGKVPKMQGYSKFEYVIHDTMSDGLLPANAAYAPTTVSVKIGNVDPLASSEYTVAQGTGGDTFTITINDLKKLVDNKTVNVGDTITVKYTAVLDDDAFKQETTNKATLEYSSNPNVSATKTTTPASTVYVYNFGLDVEKVVKDATDKKLAGAKFKLKHPSENLYYKWDTDTKKVTWVAEASANEFVTGDDGKFTDTNSFKGLDAGTYQLKETVAPAGYNVMAPQDVVITASLDSNGKIIDGTSCTVGGTAATENPKNLFFTAQIANAKGAELPSTGGIGTTIFYIVGGALMIGALVLLLTKKKMSNK